jgi:hypothetical protein
MSTARDFTNQGLEEWRLFGRRDVGHRHGNDVRFGEEAGERGDGNQERLARLEDGDLADCDRTAVPEMSHVDPQRRAGRAGPQE